MSSKLFQILSLLLFFYMTFDSPAPAVAQECPYPCYPPPTGAGNTPPTNTYKTPPQTGYYSPPSSVFPYNPPNPDYYGDGPPAPDPIVPWFPFYYKKPPHNPDQSSSPGVRTVFLTHLLVSSFLLLVS